MCFLKSETRPVHGPAIRMAPSAVPRRADPATTTFTVHSDAYDRVWQVRATPARLIGGFGRGRESGYPLPPAHTRAGAASAHALARLAHFPGSVSGTGWAVACSPWSTAFPPQPPPAAPRFCSAASSVLYRCTTPRDRARGTCRSSRSPSGPSYLLDGQPRGLPVLAHGVSPHAWGLRLRRAEGGLALAPALVLPSVRSDSVGARNQLISELNVLPTDAPLQRFKCGLTTALAWLGARVARYAFPVRLFHTQVGSRTGAVP